MTKACGENLETHGTWDEDFSKSDFFTKEICRHYIKCKKRS